MLNLSILSHTWIFDIDGTLLKHNGYKVDGYDTLLDGVREFFATLPKDDMVILLTAREEHCIPQLKKFLESNSIRYNYIISNVPLGERILINDTKPSGLKTAYAINKKRDYALKLPYIIKNDL